MTCLKWPSLALATTMMLGFAGATAVHAQSNQQQAQQQQQRQQQAPSAQNFSDEELKAFAGAAQQVQAINRNFQSRFQSAESPEKRQQLQQGARQEMVSAIQEEGLSVEQYNQIAKAAQGDPDLAEQVQAYMSNSQ
jgi:biopolymer transport protein ExbB/TolQ